VAAQVLVVLLEVVTLRLQRHLKEIQAGHLALMALLMRQAVAVVALVVLVGVRPLRVAALVALVV